MHAWVVNSQLLSTLDKMEAQRYKYEIETLQEKLEEQNRVNIKCFIKN